MPSISKAGLNASISLSTRNGVDNLLDIDKNKVLNISKHLELRIVKVLGKVVATDYGGEEARNRPDDIPTVSAIELKWEAVRERIEGDVESFWAKFDELNPELVEQAQWKARKRNFLRKLIKSKKDFSITFRITSPYSRTVPFTFEQTESCKDIHDSDKPKTKTHRRRFQGPTPAAAPPAVQMQV